MIRIIWEFQVADTQTRLFELAYGPEGAWSQLFRRAEGYQGTLLLRDEPLSGRYLTIDHWTEMSAFEKFHERFAKEYAQLNRECENLTLSEQKIGLFKNIL